MLPCHHEDSNPVLLVTKEVFYLSNSGGKRYGVNHELKKERAALPLSYRSTSGPAGTRTQNLPVRSRSNPLLRIAAPVRTVGIEPTTPVWKTGMFPLHHVHEAGENKTAQAVRPVRACRDRFEVTHAYAAPAAEPAGFEPATSRASIGRSSA